MRQVSLYTLVLLIASFSLHARRDRFESLFGNGLESQIEQVREHLGEYPNDHQAKIALISMLLDDGQYPLAIHEVETMCSGKPEDADFHYILSQYMWAKYEHGPGLSPTASGFSYKPIAEDFDRDKWNANMLEGTRKRLAKALDAQPGHEPAMVLQGHVFMEQQDLDALKALADAAEEILPGFAWIPFFRAKVQMAADNKEKALEQIEIALTRTSNEPIILSYASELFKESGDLERSTSLKKQSQFYGVVPPYIGWEYSDSAHEILKCLRLFPGEEGMELTDEEREKVNSVFEETVTRLSKEDSQDSNLALSIVCFTHSEHGRWEELSYKTLEERGQRDLLRILLGTARSNCAIASAGAALARLKDPSAFDMLISMLPNDTAPIFSANVAYSLSLLGDMRAVDPLIEIARKGDGYAQEEAILALGSFTQLEDVQKTLRKFRMKRGLNTLADVALYRMDKDPKRIARIEKSVIQRESVNGFRVIRYLELIEDPLARELTNKIREHMKARHEKFMAEQEAKRKKLES